MSWVKLDDGLDEHEKIERLLERDELQGLAAVGLLALTLTNSGRRLTDGRVARRVIRRLAREHGDDLVAALRDVGFYDPPDPGDDDSVQIHDFLDHNPSREAVLKRRREDAERKAKAREEAARVRKDSERPSDRTAKRTPDGPRKAPVVREDVQPESEQPSALPGPARPGPARPHNPPIPPEGGRERDRIAYEDSLRAWAEDLLPRAESDDALAAVRAAMGVSLKEQPTREDVIAGIKKWRPELLEGLQEVAA